MVSINEEPEPLNVQVGRRIYHVETLHPAWYPVPVLGFYEHDSGYPHMIHSWDKKYCNAIMYANGVDSEHGSASPLPFYEEESGEFAHLVIRAIHDKGGELTTTSSAGSVSASIQVSPGEKVYFSGENLAEVICHLFVSAYPPIDPMP